MKHFLVNTSLLNRPHSGIARYLNGIYKNWPESCDLQPLFFDGKNIKNNLNDDVSHQQNSNWIPIIKRVIPNAYQIKNFLQNRNLKKIKVNHPFTLYHEPNFIPITTSYPFITTIHDLTFKEFPETLPKDRLAWIQNNFKGTVSKAKLILTVSSTIKEEIIKNYPIDPEKILVTFNGYNWDNINQDESTFSFDEINLKPKSFFLFVGNIEPRKNLDFLIEIYENLGKEFTKSHPLVLVGGSHIYQTYAQNLIKKFNGLNIIHLTNINDQQLKALYQSALALLFPSIYEGFGLPILEAAAQKTPVIASKIPVFEELFSSYATLCGLEEKSKWIINIKNIAAQKPHQHDIEIQDLKDKFCWKKSSQIMAEKVEEIARNLEA